MWTTKSNKLKVSLCILWLATVSKIANSMDSCEVSSNVTGMCMARANCGTLNKGSTVKMCPGTNNMMCCPLWRKVAWPAETTRNTNQPLRSTARATKIENGCGVRSVSRRSKRSLDMDEQDVEVDENSSAPNLTKEMIVGGRTAVKGAWPWMAGILEERNLFGSKSYAFFCGGVLISNNYVMTAAHCLYPYMRSRSRAKANIKIIKVRIGAHTKTDGKTYGVAKMSYHERYGSNYGNDIGLLKIGTPVTFDLHVKPICLPSVGEPISDPLYIIGWGTTRSGGPASSVLKEAQVKRVSMASCKRNYNRIGMRLTDNQICAGQRNTDTCQGDSGGPLMMYSKEKKRWFSIGITSFGNGCANPTYPGVYTKVESYITWIKSKIKD